MYSVFYRALESAFGGRNYGGRFYEYATFFKTVRNRKKLYLLVDDHCPKILSKADNNR
jgi:hypothetical protein